VTPLSSLRCPWALALLGASLGAGAQTPAPAPPAADAGTSVAAPPRAAVPALAAADRRFALAALVGGMAQVELGPIAQQRGGGQIQSMAQRIAQEHAGAHAELVRIAAAKGVAAPRALGGEHRLTLDRLKQLSGVEFDRAYVEHMLGERRRSVDAFELASRTIVDSELRDFALRSLPMLQVHLQLAQTADASLRSAAVR
jgi:putative membrane protein